MASSLVINGVTLSPADVASRNIEFHELTLEYDEPERFEFSENSGQPIPTYIEGQSVELTVDGQTTPSFKGRIVAINPRFNGNNNWSHVASVLGLRYLADRITIINPTDFTGFMVFNRPSLDTFFLPTEAGLTVGAMIRRVLDGQMARLNAIGIAGYVSTDLDALDITPPEQVEFSGPLLRSICSVLSRWQGNHGTKIQYEPSTSDWRIRIVDMLAMTPTTLRFGDDPIDPEGFRISFDISGCFTRVVALGRGDMGVAFLDTRDGGLTPTWTSDQQNDWRWLDFIEPAGAYSEGNISGLTATQATFDPDDATETWDTNQWATNHASVYVVNSVASGLVSYSEMRFMTSNGALTAGGTATGSWAGDRPLDTAGYTRYKLVGDPINSRRMVYREFDISPVWVKEHLELKYDKGFKWGNANTETVCYFPACAVDWSNVSTDAYGYADPNKLASSPMGIWLNRVDGKVILWEPAVKANNNLSDLNKGGSSVKPYVNVRVALPYSRGPLEAPCPANLAGYGYSDEHGATYSGTAYTKAGIAETYPLVIPDWLDERDRPNMLKLACMVLATLQDIKIDGSVSYKGLYAPALALDMALNFTGGPISAPYDLDMGAINCPIRGVTIHWINDGSDGEFYETSIHFRNNREIATSESIYAPQHFGSDPRFGGGGFGGGFGSLGNLEGMTPSGPAFGGTYGNQAFGAAADYGASTFGGAQQAGAGAMLGMQAGGVGGMQGAQAAGVGQMAGVQGAALGQMSDIAATGGEPQADMSAFGDVFGTTMAAPPPGRTDPTVGLPDQMGETPKAERVAAAQARREEAFGVSRGISQASEMEKAQRAESEGRTPPVVGAAREQDRLVNESRRTAGLRPLGGPTETFPQYAGRQESEAASVESRRAAAATPEMKQREADRQREREETFAKMRDERKNKDLANEPAIGPGSAGFYNEAGGG